MCIDVCMRQVLYLADQNVYPEGESILFSSATRLVIFWRTIHLGGRGGDLFC